MIVFDCPVCGKHYTFSDRFGGRPMVCTDCKSPLVVPKTKEPVRLVQPPPLPTPPQPQLPIPPQPLSPPAASTSLPVTPTENHENHNVDHDDLAILAYVFEEKHQEREKEKVQQPTSLPTSQTSQMNQMDQMNQKTSSEPKTQRKSLVLYRGSLVLVVLGLIGLGFFLVFYVDWRSPDPRPEILKKIEQRKIEAIIEAKNQETESETLRLRSLELWNRSGEAVDALTVTLSQDDAKHETPATATEQRLNDLRNMIQTAVRQAAETETGKKKAIRNARIYRTESKFFEEQETELRKQIQQFPNDRTHLTMPVFDREQQTVAVKESISLGSDWTENLFEQFAFPEMTQFYAVFDGVKRLYGDKSLRVTSLEQVPITISFLKNATKNEVTPVMPERAGCFVFSIRFPEITDLLRIGKDAHVGKIGTIRVRFVYSAGRIEFETVSPRYCNALFYDACGRFVPVEFPLTGDSFWKRTDPFDGTKIELTDQPVERIEICLTPLSDRTTFWLDGIALTEKMAHEPYDLLRAEIRQAEIRNREKEHFVNFVKKIQLPAVSKSSEDSTEDLTGKNFDDKNSGHSGEEGMLSAFQWVLQTAQGTIRIRRDDVVTTLDSQSRIPEFEKTITVEEIDLTGFRDMTEEHLNQLGGLKKIKRLNLSRTALRNENLIKLATLTSLESLNLAENELTFEGLPAIRTLKGLKELNLGNMKPSVDGIDALGTMTSLRSLNLSRSGIDNSDLMYLLPLADLETLNLSATKIGDRGLPIFRVFTELQSLDLSATRITDNGLAALIPLRNLRVLKLNDTALSNACLGSLGKMKKLETISVFKTAITQDAVRQELSPAKFNCFQFTE
ncbi:MAG: hypothetical protein LBQ50_05995 [Planctomycetaceae bacterium]|jgi:hypothetical protein|nr:hypothetical protein [Planctomycetaceae bacterium]